ncbi:Zinc finger DNA binding protein [Operophtera brumata]|uniref:Zinc finger DNA binding protein n=1 Tax=Operophtera brumata TaxID=104452 RepID=A0A0L7LG99_OPEBR|nr:Zinc finger DNA binding protein [Operophtera brumata]
MPLTRRSPPSTSEQSQDNVQKNKQVIIPDHVESESVYSNTSEDDDRPSSRTATRSKRKIDLAIDAGDVQSAVSEMRVLFANLSSKHEKQFGSLRSSIESFKSEMSDLARTIEFLSQKQDTYQDKIAKLESEKEDNHRIIQVLETRVDILERKSRNSCIELRNVPKTKQSEAKSHLCDVITSLGNTLDVKILEQDISDIYRVNTKIESTNPIVVEFVSALKKETLLNTIKRFNKGKKKEDKLNTRHVKIEGPARPVFVSESLTQKAKKLFFLSRDFAKTHGYDYCWTSNGNVYLRKKENMPLIRVVHEADLVKLQEVK